MNTIPAVLEKQDEDLYLRISKETLIKLPESKANKLIQTDYIGKEVIAGIRPECLHDDEAYISSMPDSVVNARVDITEMMGAETFLYITVEGQKFTARVSPRTKAQSGDIIKIALDANRIHLFDKDTEKTIIN